MAYSMEHTAVYTDSGPRSPKTKYHNDFRTGPYFIMHTAFVLKEQ